jgi:hypothetical protein
MNRFLNTLKVLPNPWATLDHVGRPNHAVPFDPEHNPDRGWVGAELDREQTRVTSVPPKHENRNARQITVFKFSAEPVVLPITEHYLRALKDGSLIAADSATAQRAQMPYRDPGTMLEQTRKSAIATFDREYGDGAWEYLKSKRNQLVVEELEAPPPIEPVLEPSAKSATPTHKKLEK